MLKRSILVLPAIVLALAVASASAQDAVELPKELRLLVQRGLVTLGFDPGPADGLFGPKTRQAIAAWQSAKGFDPATGYLTLEQAAALATIGKEAADKLPELHVGPAKEVPLPAQGNASSAALLHTAKAEGLVSTNARCADDVKRDCWIELSNKPNCYVWRGRRGPAAEVTWDGECSETDSMVAHGTGTLRNKAKSTARFEETGEMVYGKKHGQWVDRNWHDISDRTDPWDLFT